MIKKQVNFNPEVFSVLSHYPKWLGMILEAIDKPILDKSYCPEVIEVFDQYGLLTGKIHGLSSYECTRNSQQKSDFTAWLIDGELAVFYVGSELVINRLEGRQGAAKSAVLGSPQVEQLFKTGGTGQGEIRLMI